MCMMDGLLYVTLIGSQTIPIRGRILDLTGRQKLKKKSYAPCLITLQCLSIGTHKTINFPFVPNEKLMVLGVTIFEHIIIRL